MDYLSFGIGMCFGLIGGIVLAVGLSMFLSNAWLPKETDWTVGGKV